MTVLHREKENFCVSFHGKTLPTGQPSRQHIAPLHSIIPQASDMSMSDQQFIYYNISTNDPNNFVNI
jgi:hypothetical protein